MPTRDMALPVRHALILSAATANAARRLKLTASDLGYILGISRASASRLVQGTFQMKEGNKSWEMALLLIRLYRGVASLVGNDDALAVRWLCSPNIAFNNACPYDYIKSVVGLVFACEYVDSHR